MQPRVMERDQCVARAISVQLHAGARDLCVFSAASAQPARSPRSLRSHRSASGPPRGALNFWLAHGMCTTRPTIVHNARPLCGTRKLCVRSCLPSVLSICVHYPRVRTLGHSYSRAARANIAQRARPLCTEYRNCYTSTHGHMAVSTLLPHTIPGR